MSVRNSRARLCAVLFFSLFTSIVFADTDFINWETNAGGAPPIGFLLPAGVTTDGGATVEVDQAVRPAVIAPANYLPGWSVQSAHALYWTNQQVPGLNTISFSDFNGISVCGFSTYIAPIEAGPFTAQIEAFTSSGSQLATTAPGSDTDATLISISSAEPMDQVEITMLVTDGGYPSYYAINRVELTTCDTAPKLLCDGFGPPMGVFPVKARKNGVFPLKMELFDADGLEMTDADLAAAPVVEVIFTSAVSSDVEDVSSYVLGVGHATDGNEFAYTEDGIWQFNLQSKGYSSEGTYLVTAVSGDDSEYVIDPSCVTSFARE